MTKAPSSKMPLGMDDFKKLIETDCFFVDKSKLIIDILGNRSEVTLITRPRRFGKTLNLSMLRYFFDVNGKEEHRKLFAGLAVSRDKQAMSVMGQYPVLMLSLKGMKSSSLEDQLDYFKTLMKKLYEQHLYLRQPGYGTSYITGKYLLENALADYARTQELQGKPFVTKDFFNALNSIGNIPISLGHWQMTGQKKHLTLVFND